MIPSDPNRTLEYEVADGWEPLCKFLGKEVPKDVPFPHLNKSVGTQNLVDQRWRALMREALSNAAMAIGPPAIAVLAVATATWIKIRHRL